MMELQYAIGTSWDSGEEKIDVEEKIDIEEKVGESGEKSSSSKSGDDDNDE